MKYIILLPVSYLLGTFIQTTVSPFGFSFSPLVMVVVTIMILWSLSKGK